MSLSRLILRNPRVKDLVAPSPLFSYTYTYRWTSNSFTSPATTLTGDHPQKDDGKQISVSDATNKSKPLSPTTTHFPPLSVVGNAIVEAGKKMRRVVERVSPFHLIRRFKEKEGSYKITYEMPGLSKDDVKITIEDDGMLIIKAEYKEEERDGDDELWWAVRYGYYDTRLMLPEDANVDGIKAEMKDGVLHLTIPKDHNKKRHIKNVQLT